jgi:hypothetical protein
MRIFGWSRGWTRAQLIGSALALATPIAVTAAEPAAPTPAVKTTEVAPVATDATPVPISTTIIESSDFLQETGSCTDGCCEIYDPCGVRCCACPPGRFWIRGEVLLWWLQGQNTPPLVTSSPAGTPVNQAGVLGAPGTTVLYGGDDINGSMLPGGRFTAGFWFDECQTVGIQSSFFFLANDANNFIAGSSGSTILARPFFDSNPAVNAQNSELVSYPGLLAGAVGVSSRSQLLGADALLRKNLCCHSCGGCDTCEDPCASCFSVPGLNCCRIDLLTGFRYMHLNDSLGVNENLTVTSQSGPFVPGTNILVNDYFKTNNNFYGYDIGGSMSCYKGRWFFDLTGRIAFGVNNRSATISGSTTSTVPGGSVTTTPGGLLAQPTNIGSYDDSVFSVVPEGQFNIGYQLTRHLRIYTGYTFLYFTNVARAGKQIDPNVNSSQIGGDPLNGPARPAFSFQDSGMWAQGINVGGELRF